MTSLEYTEHWKEYWENQYESSTRQQLVLAARRPLTRWLIADVGVLVDDVGIALDDIQHRPDEVLRAGQIGFEQFVEESAVEGTSEDRYNFLPIHLVGLSRVGRERRYGLETLLEAVDTLTTLPTVPLVTEPEVTYRPAVITYQCPADHQTVLVQPLHRVKTVTSCGNSDCTNDVHVEPSLTRVRPVVEFSVDYHDQPLRCVSTGRLTQTASEQISGASTVHLTGIVRLDVDAAGDVDFVYEVLYAGRS